MPCQRGFQPRLVEGSFRRVRFWPQTVRLDSLPWSGGRLAFCGARVSTARWCALVPYTGKQHTPCHTRTSLLLKAWRATAVRTRTPS